MGLIIKNGIPYGGGGSGTEYTAGNGILIENDEISVKEASAADIAEIVSPKPGVTNRKMKYSTDEQVIGEWIDGKPLYQKTIDCGFAPSTVTDNSKWFIVGNNIDFICIVNSFYMCPNDGNQTGSLPYASGTDYRIEISASSKFSNDTNGYIGINVKRDRSAFRIYVTIQYTKTTDTSI